MLKISLGIFISILVFIGYTFLNLPDVKKLNTCMTTSMYQVKLCPGSPSYVKLKDVSPHMINALLVAEDSAFFSHNGFDWYELKQSFSENLKSGKIHRGGSTITQQLAKNAFLYKEKSYWRKIKEAYLTYSLEKNFTKEQLLEKYLNIVEFGPNLFGIKAAAKHYFQKSPKDLNPLESSFLAFLLPNPKVYSKSFNKGTLTPFATKMIRVILQRLYSFKKIDANTYAFAKSQINYFPWTNLSSSDFVASANSLFSGVTNSTSEEEVVDEAVLEKLMADELKGQPSASDEEPEATSEDLPTEPIDSPEEAVPSEE